MSAPPPLEVAAANLPCERYGLQLVDESASAAYRPVEPPSRPLRLFDWGLLAGFGALQIAHLAALALSARWALRQLIGG